eukprot:Seg2186.3 transcript_id=Seg2186.3/GoldUCD/mRNA.D3Y31 product="Protein lifeguard 4" protein_id=Seg2186.3/GoldUCD/D3Y31
MATFHTIQMDDPLENREKGSIHDDMFRSATVAQSSLQIRLGFIRKVYGILTAQLLLTTITAALFMFTQPIKEFVQESPGFLLGGVVMSLVLIVALMVKRKETPTNFYLLAAFTLCEAYTIGTVVTFFDQFVVLQAFILTVGTTIALTVYTFQSKKDFSTWGASLFNILWILVLAGFMQILMPSEILHLGIAVAGAVIFSCFIVFDTHMLIHKLSPEEYIVAAINLYLDILNLFLEILKILDAMKRN